MLPDSTTEAAVENTNEETFYVVRPTQGSRMSPRQIAQYFECFATNNDAHYDDNECPIAYHIIRNHQTNDHNLQKLLTSCDQYVKKNFIDVELIFRAGRFGAKIVIPQTLSSSLLSWYQEFLSHPGENHTKQALRQHYWWLRMTADISAYVRTWDLCQRLKR